MIPDIMPNVNINASARILIKMANLMVDKDIYGRDVFANSRSSLLHLSQVLIGIGQMAKIL